MKRGGPSKELLKKLKRMDDSKEVVWKSVTEYSCGHRLLVRYRVRVWQIIQTPGSFPRHVVLKAKCHRCGRGRRRRGE